MSSDPTIWHPGTTPDLSGRTYLVTGTSPGGIGQYVARDLAAAGARVVMAARNARRLASAVDLVRAEVPDADLDELLLDLASMEAVRRAAHEAEHFGPLHGLVNNAGVMVSAPQRTVDGLDLQMATNHFGPFLLTGMLLPQLAASGDGRVVSVSSQAHRAARTAPTGEPRLTEPPKIRMQAYGQSKLANLLFTYELDRRLQQSGLPVKALAAHPGYSATPLFANGRFGRPSGGGASIVDAVHKALAQPAAHGAWPILMATVANLPGSTYCGPSGRGEARGLPKVVRPSDLALDPRAQHELWEVSERTVGLRYPR